MRFLTAALPFLLVVLVASNTSAVNNRVVRIDFSTHGIGPLEPDFYKKQGVRFTEGAFVGFIQGDEAFGPVEGTFTPPVSDLSIQVAPAEQGAAEYTLTAYSPSGVSSAPSVKWSSRTAATRIPDRSATSPSNSRT